MARFSTLLSTRLHSALHRSSPEKLKDAITAAQKPQEREVAESSQSARSSPKNTCLQEQSPLFRLPAEIRVQIYRAVFQEAICHIVSWQSGLSHYCCCGARTDTFQLDTPCWGHFWCGDKPDTTIKWGKQKSALLRTCRRLCNETLPILYASQKLVFSGTTVLLDFAAAVPPQNMRYISFIEISAPSIYALHYVDNASCRRDIQDWQRCIAILSDLVGLKTLYVVVPNSRLHNHWQHTKADEQRVLEPLLQISRPPQTFVVAIAWYEGGRWQRQDEESDRYPFEVRRFDGHLPGM